MKVIILAGGLGTRLMEETVVKPKPMVEVGGRPIIWHIMNIYAHYGFKEFVVALGYKGDVIKSYFLDQYYLENDLTINLADGKKQVHDTASQRLARASHRYRIGDADIGAHSEIEEVDQQRNVHAHLR